VPNTKFAIIYVPVVYRGKKQYCMRSANNNKSIDIKLSVDDVPPEQPPSGMLKSK
jgi:hypothetical protein